MFKKHGIQFLTETVDIEILQRVLFSLVNKRPKITEAYLNGGDQPHIKDRFQFQRYRVIKEFTTEENARQSGANKHDLVFCFGVWAVFRNCYRTIENDIIVRRGTLKREDILPPVVYGIDFGEKSVAAHIHAISFVVDSF